MVFQRCAISLSLLLRLCAALLCNGSAGSSIYRCDKCEAQRWMARPKLSQRRRNRCKLLRFGSSFWYLIFIDGPAPQMTSNLDVFRKATVRRVLREVSLGPLVILRPALLLCPRCARCSGTNDRQAKRTRELSGDSPGRVVVAFGPSAAGGRFTTFEQQLGAHAS